jgi:phage gpG-like protein
MAVVQNPAAHFELSLDRILKQYVRQAGHTLWQPGSALWDRAPVPDRCPFLQNQEDRYLVVSIDPAGGGVLSDEVLVVFLIADEQFGLLTARIVPGHHRRYAFSMVPLVFVLSLIRTLVDVKRLLQKAHTKAGLPDDQFRLPPVIVLVENNFAYGAATYMQMLWLLRDRSRALLPELDLTFATPVYGLNQWLTVQYAELARKKHSVDKEQASRDEMREALRQAWLAKGKRHKGMNWNNLYQRIRTTLPEGGALPLTNIQEEIAEAMNDLLDAAADASADPVERRTTLEAWARDSEVLAVATAFAIASRNTKKLQEEARRLRDGITNYLSGNGGTAGTDHAFAAIHSWRPGRTARRGLCPSVGSGPPVGSGRQGDPVSRGALLERQQGRD